MKAGGWEMTQRAGVYVYGLPTVLIIQFLAIQVPLNTAMYSQKHFLSLKLSALVCEHKSLN